MNDWKEIHEKCNGCSRVTYDGELDIDRCTAYKNPSVWWRHDEDFCPLATHLAVQAEKAQGKLRLGQQKHKKGW